MNGLVRTDLAATKALKARKYYNALSLFSGAGGLDIGFHESGEIRTIACYEFDEDCVQTLVSNRSKLIVDGASRKHPQIFRADLSKSDVLSSIEELGVKIDVVFGGPPCQSFSIMGKKGATEDARGALIFAFLEVVSRLRPKAFLFENVPHFAAIDGGRVADEFLGRLEEQGYSLWSGHLNAADYGALTFRTRFFVIGMQGYAKVPPPRPTHTNSAQVELFDESVAERWRTCQRVFVDIEAEEGRGRTLLNHEVVNHTPATIERFRGLAFGETDNIRKRNRLDPNRPAHSIYVGGKTGKLQARTHIHPYFPRELTPRECALIQGFPIDWEFCGRRDSVVLQVANSVPVPLARALAKHIVSELERRSLVRKAGAVAPKRDNRSMKGAATKNKRRGVMGI
jgi:DNA (cytosine-5)-methyltransferase 1